MKKNCSWNVIIAVQLFLVCCPVSALTQEILLSGWYKYIDNSGKVWPIGVWIGPEGLAKFQLYVPTYQASWTRKGSVLLVNWQDSEGDTNVQRFEIRTGNKLYDVDEEKILTHVP